MKKLSFVLAAALLLFTSCTPPVKNKNGTVYKSSIDYNDYIVNRQNEIIEYVLKFSKESTTDLDKAEQTIDSAVVHIDRIVTDIEGMPAWKNNTGLRDNALALFKFYKTTFSQSYMQIIAMQKDGEVTEDEQKQSEVIVDKITSAEEKLDQSFQNAQADFAKANGFRFKKNELQDKIDDLEK
jgi:hypothetical protein